MPYINTDVEVWVDLDQFEDEELVAEMNRRGLSGAGTHGTVGQVIQTMYEYEAMGKDIQPLLRELYYTALSKIA